MFIFYYSLASSQASMNRSNINNCESSSGILDLERVEGNLKLISSQIQISLSKYLKVPSEFCILNESVVF